MVLYEVTGTGLMCTSFASPRLGLSFQLSKLSTSFCGFYADINNVGTISQALIAQEDPEYDPAYAARVQAKQVTIVSLMNCLGRICFGMYVSCTQ